MSSFTYTTKYEECSKDSFRNNCEYDCCVSYSGGKTATLFMCSPALEEDVTCQDSFETIQSTANTCTNDDAGNTCATSCCLTVANQVTCADQAYCNGYNLNAYTRDNIISYGDSLGVAISPQKNISNSASAIGGIITFGIACSILLFVIIVTLYQLFKVKKQNHLVSYHAQKQAQAQSGKQIYHQGTPLKSQF